MIGQRIVGNRGKAFTIIRELGRGSFGIVYLAADDAERQYAVKLVSPVTDPAIKLSFEQEISSTVGLVHENLLEVIDYGRCDIRGEEGLFAVCEYCEGGDYRQVLRQYTQQPFDIDRLVSDIRQILSGLAALHTRIIHRDLKPENILVSNGKLKIGDFGLAKFVDEATRTLTFKGGGTPLYMPPEVWLGKKVTPATDLYAAGVIFFEAITGQPPFSDANLDALRRKHLFDPVPSASQANSNSPRAFDGIIKKLLAKDPRDRYQTANEVLDALTAITMPREAAIAEIAEHARRHLDEAERKRLEQERARNAEEEARALDKYMERQILDSVEAIIQEINNLLPGPKIQSTGNQDGRDYHFENRTLEVRFFDAHELFTNPIVPGRMEILRKRHVVHGGYIRIVDEQGDREGWNLVLVRPPDSVYGEWRIVETRFSPLVAQRARFEPFATDPGLFADNLACHWTPALHVYNLKDKPLEREDLVKAVEKFIPNPAAGQ